MQREEENVVKIAEFLTGNSWIVYVFIFVGKMIEVALASLRSQLIHKGQRVYGGIVALFEYTFWITITASAISGFRDDLLKVVILILAFSCGNILGSFIEEKLALGYSTLTGFFTNEKEANLAAETLRQRGHALTILPSLGMDNKQRFTMITSIMRKDVHAIIKTLNDVVPEAVIVVSQSQPSKQQSKFAIKK